jgi:peptide/nickel transport system substrate-binding protein
VRRIATRSSNIVRVAFLFLAMALFATACASGESGGEEGDGDTGGGTQAGEEDAGPPQRGGSVVYGLEAETTNGWCLPEAQLAIAGIQVARSIYDTLTIPDGEGDFQPFLAESVTPNAEYTEWVIQLREGITFHDGTPLDATVVKNNLDAYRGTYPGRTSLLFSFVLQDIADVVVDGPMTVRVVTSRPWVAFPSFLYSSGRMGIIAQAQLDDAEACGRNLIGTGPFQLVDWRVNSSMQLERNPNYWRTDEDGNELPYLDTLEYRPNPEPQQLANGVRSGELDAAHMSSITGSLILEDLRGLAEDGEINLVESDDFAEVGFLMLNTTRPPFDNPIAREAVALAVNREESNQILANGVPELANGPFAPGALGYVEDSGFTAGDPERAAELVEQYESETGQPLEFEITSTQGTELQRLVELQQQYFEDAGMTVRVTVLEQSALIQRAIEKSYDMVTFRNYPGFDPDNLYVWWYDGSTNPVNFPGFNDPEVNDLLDRGRETPDPEERREIYEELNRELNREHYFLWGTWAIWFIPMGPDVHGIVGGRPVDGGDDYTGLAVGHDPALIWKEQ